MSSISRYFGRNDIILLIVAFFVIIVVYAGSYYLHNETGDMVIVTVDGEVYGEYPLNVDEVISVEIDGEVANTIVIERNEVRMSDATCPDRLCVKQGSIHLASSSIVCLPHRVVVSITGEDKEFDSMAR